MAIDLSYESESFIKLPTIVLAKKNGKKQGVLPAHSVAIEENLNSKSTLSFTVFKEENGVLLENWNEIKNFKLAWCEEWDYWYEMTVTTDESVHTSKTITCTSIGEAELSRINIYGVEINTDDDIERDDYAESVLYNPDNPHASILHRILENAPHYTIKHVDETIKGLFRSFSFDNKSIMDAFNEIAEEIGCLFVLSTNSKEDGSPERGIYVYDLKNTCNICGNRDDFVNVCSECGSTDITYGYGEDTTIFINSENIADSISLSSNTDNINNCFKLETGDDLMTAAVASINPNGSSYLWYISDSQKEDMSDELAEKLSSYNEVYDYYENKYQIPYDDELLDSYNELVDKYIDYDTSLKKLSKSSGFSNLIEAIYDSTDFELLLRNSLMPTIELTKSTAESEASKLTVENLSPIAVVNYSSISHATADSNVLSMAKAIVRATYQVVIKESSFDKNNNTWQGIFTVTNYSDENDTYDSDQITLAISDDYEQYVRQKIEKVVARNATDDSYDIASLFKENLNDDGTGEFADDIKKYALNPLNRFHDCCQSCLDILIQEGISDDGVWSAQSKNLYNEFYAKYYQRLNALELEIGIRQKELEIINKLFENAVSIRNNIQSNLNIENYLGNTLWTELSTFKRMSTYKNENYISDGLNNVQIIDRAKEFILVARKELVKSADLQLEIEASVKNLLLIPDFEPLKSHFSLGNWIRVRVDDDIYRLRLINYTFNFDNPSDLKVTFSDVNKNNNSINTVAGILSQASSMSSSYDTVKHQASKAVETTKTVNDWSTNGIDTSTTHITSGTNGTEMSWDEHGFLLRQFDEATGRYSPEQSKIINSTYSITDDNWKTTKTAIGKFSYINPATGKRETAYGVNGEVLVGRLILGDKLELYSDNRSMIFNGNGLILDTNGENGAIFTVQNGDNKFIYTDGEGNIHISGNIIIEAINDDSTISIKGNVLEDSSITATQISPYSITSAEIAPKTITANNIKDSTITSRQIASGTITSENIANDTITSRQIASGTITSENIANDTITAEKFAEQTIPANKIDLQDLFAQDINASGSIKGIAIVDSPISNESGDFSISQDGDIRGANIVSSVTDDSGNVSAIVLHDGSLRFLYNSNILGTIAPYYTDNSIGGIFISSQSDLLLNNNKLLQKSDISWSSSGGLSGSDSFTIPDGFEEAIIIISNSIDESTRTMSCKAIITKSDLSNSINASFYFDANNYVSYCIDVSSEGIISLNDQWCKCVYDGIEHSNLEAVNYRVDYR